MLLSYIPSDEPHHNDVERGDLIKKIVMFSDAEYIHKPEEETDKRSVFNSQPSLYGYILYQRCTSIYRIPSLFPE